MRDAYKTFKLNFIHKYTDGVGSCNKFNSLRSEKERKKKSIRNENVIMCVICLANNLLSPLCKLLSYMISR